MKTLVIPEHKRIAAMIRFGDDCLLFMEVFDGLAIHDQLNFQILSRDSHAVAIVKNGEIHVGFQETVKPIIDDIRKRKTREPRQISSMIEEMCSFFFERELNVRWRSDFLLAEEAEILLLQDGF